MKRVSLSLFVSLVTVSVFAVAAVGSDEDYVPTFKDIISLKTPRQAKISPDGSYVVYVVQETNWEKDTYDTRIWLRE